MKKWEIHFVPHTHWDKEWYFKKQVSDIFLIDNINKMKELIEKNENDFKSYIYDGQYSIIDDYLSYFPEEVDNIRKLTESQKLIIGPWYTQPDTANVLGESLTRNLLIGCKESEKWGSQMRIGYVPDSFGFNANMPQIFKNAEMKAMIHWRGIYSKHLEEGVYNLWEGLDGTKIPVYNLFRWGYSVAVGAFLKIYEDNWTTENMANQAKLYLENIHDNLETLKTLTKNTNNKLLLPFGSDQLPIPEGLNKFMAELNKIDPEHHWKLSTYDDYFDELLNQQTLNVLSVWTHELRFAQYSRTHKTITSNRYDIKKKSRNLEYLIYHELEPLALIFQKFGGHYPERVILKATKLLLECHAHDSMGGCNTDETNQSVVERLDQATSIVESQITLIKRRIIKAIDLSHNELIFFNLWPRSKSLTKELWIFTKQPCFEIYDNNTKLNFAILEQKHINHKEFKIYQDTYLQDTTYNYDQEKGHFCTKILLTVDNVPSIGYKILNIKENNNKFNILTANTHSLENDYLLLEINKQGSIDITNKKTNETITNALYLTSDFDAGDTYDYSPSHHNQNTTNKLITWNSHIISNTITKTIKITYLYSVPKELDSEHYIEQEVELNICLYNESLFININLDNKAKDIRWRLNHKTNIIDNTSYSDTAYGVISRPYHLQENEIWAQNNWKEQPVEIEGMETVTYLKNNDKMHAIFTKGNNEYQITDDQSGTIAVTLFRAVSHIGNRHLLFRPGRASGIDAYPHKTPNSNLNIPLSFNLNLYIGKNIENKIVQRAKEWAVDACYYQNQRIHQFYWKGDTFVMTKQPLNKMPRSFSLFNLDESCNVLIMTTFKKRYDKEGYIIRLYNPTNQPITINPKKYQFIETTSLENLKDNTNLTLKANEFRTYYIKE